METTNNKEKNHNVFTRDTVRSSKRGEHFFHQVGLTKSIKRRQEKRPATQGSTMQSSPYFLFGESGAKGTIRGREEGIFGGKKSVKISSFRPYA
jgi:hypothetical protein